MVGLQQLVDEVIAEENKEREHPHWHVSSLGSCLTGQYLERLGKKPDKPYDARTLRVFHVGNVFEDWLLNTLERKLDGSMERQKELIDKDLDIMGHPDAIVEHETGEKEIIEVKTIHSRGFHWMAKEGRSGYDHHRLQLWLYLYMTGIEKGRIVYLSKDDLCINEYPVYITDEKAKSEARKNLAILKQAWKDQKPPTPILDPKDWKYVYCNYHLQCLEVHGVKFYEKKVGYGRNVSYQKVPLNTMKEEYARQ